MHMVARVIASFIAVIALLFSSGCATPPALPEPAPRLLDGAGNSVALDELAAELAARRVVYVGEYHDRYDHHLGQLAVAQALSRQRQRSGSGLAIGLEQIQQPFQPALDEYVAGRIDEAELLRRVEYFDRWGFDFRLYRPIFQFAREQGIPLVALNIDADLHRRFGELGRDGLTAAERAQLPQLDTTSDPAYRQRLQQIYRRHAPAPQDSTSADKKNSGFRRFYQAQLLWDEAMAERAVEYLQANPNTSLLVLAGSGHLRHRSGIPNRVQRRAAFSDALLLPAEQAAGTDAVVVPLDGADYLLLNPPAELPPAGRIGVMMGPVAAGVAVGVEVLGLAPGGAAATAGVQAGDRLLEVAGQSVASPGDVRVALLGKAPGETVELALRRHRNEASAFAELRLQLTLQP